MPTVTAEDIDQLEKRISAAQSFEKEFQAEHPEAPRWAIEVAALIDGIETRVANMESQASAMERELSADLTGQVESVERSVRALEQGIDSSRQRGGRETTDGFTLDPRK